jgi:glycosyltransferase involved in cell wall biosynthesis
MSAPPAPPVRVLHLLPLDTLAGTELMVASLILRSDSSAVDQELATLQSPGPIAERIRAGAGTVASLGGTGGLPGAAWRLARLLRTRRYDVVSAYGLKASVLARVLVRLLHPRPAFVCGVRGLFVTDVESLDTPKARLASLVERLLAPLVDVYDANSRAALDVLGRIGVGDGRLVHIPNGLDLSLWAARAVEPEGTPLILCVARFVPLKRHEDLLRALAALAREGRSFRAVLAGGGPLLGEARSLASSLGLDGVVDLPGQVGTAEVRDLLGRAAVVCLASASEGMPSTLMEAMATGVAVVATDVGGTSELIVDGESGLLVPPYDAPALVRALAGLLDDSDLRGRLGRRGRERMEQCYSVEAMLEAKERLYRDLASARRVSAW